MSPNIVTEVIDILGRFEISEAKLAWQLKQLMDKLYLVEGIYDEMSCHNMGLSVQECDRYTQEVFPSLLVQCCKLDKYFNLCPDLRQTAQDSDILRIQFLRYSKIIDRLLIKLQYGQVSSLVRFGRRIKGFVLRCAQLVSDSKNMFLHKLRHLTSHLHLPKLFFKKTLVVYRKDAVDYVNDGPCLQPIDTLYLDCA